MTNDTPATPARITVAEWLLAQGHPVPGWGVPNASVHPQAYAEWCDQEGVINDCVSVSSEGYEFREGE